MFYKARGKITKFFDDYTTFLLNANFEANYRKGLKTITPKNCC